MTALDPFPADDFDQLDAPPAFYVERPTDDKRAEIARQDQFFKLMPYVAPRVLAYPNANAGKRNPALARREHILAGVFDITALWNGRVALIEFKGCDKRGRPGKLSPAQIRFGNRCVELQVPCACFYTPEVALRWLGELGFPVRHAS